MDTARHNSDDQLRIAKLTGIASRHAGLSRHDGYDQTAAIAELHTITSTADPKLVSHLLAHAARGLREPLHDATRALLIAAGATPEDVDAHAAALDVRQQQSGPPIGAGWQQPPS